MSNYIVIYKAAASMTEQTQSADPEDMKKEIERWNAWAAKCGDGQRISKTGSSPIGENVVGYSILQAENIEGAKKLLEGHPHFESGGGCDIEIHESWPIPQ
jgi:hypothetical protein